MNARTTHATRCLLVATLLLAGACEQRPPIPVTYVPQSSAAPAGTAAEQDSRRLNRAMQRDERADRTQDADPYAGSMAGTPTPSTNLEVGGNEQQSDVPQVGIPFSGI